MVQARRSLHLLRRMAGSFAGHLLIDLDSPRLFHLTLLLPHFSGLVKERKRKPIIQSEGHIIGAITMLLDWSDSAFI